MLLGNHESLVDQECTRVVLENTRGTVGYRQGDRWVPWAHILDRIWGEQGNNQAQDNLAGR